MGISLFNRVTTSVARWPTRPAATQVAPRLMLAIALSACGGAPDMGDTATTAAAPDSMDRAMASTTDAPRGSSQPPASPGAYDIRLLDQNGWHRDSFELVPVRGAGYQTVYAIVVLRGSSTLSPVADVQPYCATALRCDYLPPRDANDAGRYTISLGDDSVARLSATKGMIAINARHLEEPRPSIVSVTLTVDGQPPVTRRITYLNAPG